MKQPYKQQQLLKRKPLKGQLNRQVKFSTKPTQTILQPTQFKSSLKSKIKQYESIENVSLIQGSSFISNKQDGSMDSMDKMIIGVSAMGIGEKQFQEDLEEGEEREQRDDRDDREEKSKGSGIDFDFNQIHKQYERLIGRNQLLGQQQQQISDEVEQSSRVLPDEDDWQIKKQSFSLSPMKKSSETNQLKQRIMKIQQKIQEIKPKKIQDSSNNSIKILVGNLGNLSEIHQQRENNFNISVDIKRKINNNEQDQQEFIDFVRQPDPQGNNLHENLHENQNENQGQGEGQHEGLVQGQGIGNQWQVSPMFQHHLQMQLHNQKKSKKTAQKHTPTNYQQILQALNSKQQAQTPQYALHQRKQHKKQPNLEFLQIFKIRQSWIKQHPTKSQNWKKKEMQILGKMKLIFENPFYDESEDEDSCQE